MLATMEHTDKNLLYEQESYRIIGAAMAVHRCLGPGFTERVYQDAIAIEFSDAAIPSQREVVLHAKYKGIELPSTFIPDFICFGKIVVELKAVKELDNVARSQAINYAKIGGYKLAILINFGRSSLEYYRFPVG